MFNSFLQNLRNPGKGTISALSVCLAIVLWGVLKMNDLYIGYIQLPCKVIDLPKDIMIKSAVLPNLTFKVKAQGGTLFWEGLKWGKDTLMLKYQPVFRKGYIILENNKNNFLHFPENMEIMNILEDTLAFAHIQNVHSKKVTVRSNLQILPAEGYDFFTSPSFSPDSIMIYGDSLNIDKIQDCMTESQRVSQIKDSVNMAIDLVSSPLYQVSHHTVQLNIKAEKYTELETDVEIVVTDLPYKTKVKPIPEVIHLRCRVPLSAYSVLENHRWQWKISYSTIQKNNPMIPQYDFFPAYMKIMPPFHPPIQFIIQKYEI